ncbi:MAG: hypothetical protein JWP97_3701 [Labilithrix sp.]|nr:hypothetical protein [Labilithrix sp.]
MSEDPRDERAPITLRVDYKRLNTFFADYTKNISKGGTFVRTERPLEVGTEFMFVLSLPEGVTLDLKGVVRWVVTEAAATSDKPAGMGIEFVFEDDEKRRQAHESVAVMMRESLGTALADKLLGGGRDPRGPAST